MPHSRFFSPSPRALLEDTAISLASHTIDAFDDPAQAQAWLRANAARADERAAGDVAARLATLTYGSSPTVALMLARCAVVIAANPVVRLRSEGLTRRVAAGTAVTIIQELARRIGYLIPEDARAPMMSTLSENRPAVATAHVNHYLERALVPYTPRPRVTILTPLGQVDTSEQERLLEVAALSRAHLEQAGYYVDVPGERLNPTARNQWESAIMFGVERSHVLGAHIVAIIADQHHSYGAAQCQTWAEATGTTVMVFSAYTSRVLSCGYWETVALPFSSAQDVASSIVDTARGAVHTAAEHALREVERRRAWGERVIVAGPELFNSERSNGLPARRLDALASDALELETLTVAELRALRASGPEAFDELADLLFGMPGEQPPAPAPTGGGVGTIKAAHMLAGDLQDHGAAMNDTPLDRASARAIVKSSAVYDAIPDPGREELLRLIKKNAVTAPELRIMLAMAGNAVAEMALGHRTHFRQTFWAWALDEVRSGRGPHR